ncbi:hypothetical protein EI94DRAFT_1805818 [Lactarius quietus]|nr:hypothetical protein EI94DRAFT_1805818 [Lactarius quietus]
MEDCGTDVVTLTEFLYSGDALLELGNPDGVLDTFEQSLQAKNMIADLSYNRLVDTLLHSDRDDLPSLSDLEIDPSDIQYVSKLMDEYHSHLMSSQVTGHDVFLMGDLWQENILIDAHQHPPRIYILDWEFTGTGLPGSEIGLFCANLDLLGRGNRLPPGQQQ